MLIWKLWIRRWKEFLTFRFHHIFSWWGKKKKEVLFSSWEDYCIFRKSFPFFQGCHLPVQCHSALRCDSVQRVYTACTAIKNHYGKTLRLKVKQHCCKIHLEMEVKFNFFLAQASLSITQILSDPVLCKSITHELCLLCYLANPISFFRVVHVSLGA